MIHLTHEDAARGIAIRSANALNSARADGPPGDCSYLTSGRYEEVRAIADAGAGTGLALLVGPGEWSVLSFDAPFSSAGRPTPHAVTRPWGTGIGR